MATQDPYGQGVLIAALSDAPNAEVLARNLAEAILRLSNMSFASATERNATLTSPVEGMRTWLRDVNREEVYDGSAWRAVWTGITTAVWDRQDAAYNLTSVTYTTTSTGGTYAHCQATFVAPTSGRIKWSLAARMEHSTTNGVLVTAEVRAGATPGSGAIVDQAADWGVSHYGTAAGRPGVSHTVSGLTPGASYNVRALHRVTGAGGSGTVSLRELIVEPLP
ncbi:hypothetical protein [Streptomyces anulatus]|uniref:hypothetical protein n=1 Tax=Streptomyces anulatus TaxID=1892 RepID=UPI002ED4F63E|nr:hypothetical protein OG882_04710 [Streptomyces anulatus]WUD92872.1 hypothetical protein OG703_33930 [Streptomyces anulatus]